MKTTTLTLALALAFIGGAGGLVQAAPAQDRQPVRVGIYDSRALAYAHFWSDAGRKERSALLDAAKAAETSGDTKRLAALKEQIAELQKRDHLQVFSTEPAEQAMAALQPRLPGLQAELGVARLVSKWDAKALRRIPEENRIDVTDRLTRELFTPTARQAKILESMKSTPPLPLDKARDMAAAGKL